MIGYRYFYELTEDEVLIILNLVPHAKSLSGKYGQNISDHWELGFVQCVGERRNGVVMSESYAVNEKRELILQSKGIYCCKWRNRKEESAGRIAH